MADVEWYTYGLLHIYIVDVLHVTRITDYIAATKKATKKLPSSIPPICSYTTNSD
jgi:hypothetical protein